MLNVLTPSNRVIVVRAILVDAFPPAVVVTNDEDTMILFSLIYFDSPHRFLYYRTSLHIDYKHHIRVPINPLDLDLGPGSCVATKVNTFLQDYGRYIL